MYTYMKKTTSEPNAETSDKSKDTGFPKTDKEFSLIDSNISPLRKMGFSSAAVPNRTGLSDKLKSGVENLSGYSLNGVKVHYNSPKLAQFRAAAYTAGKNIFVGPGHESSLPHEAWHVVQQMKGEVSATNKINGVSVNESPALEREADIMGKKALSRTEPSGSELISAEPRSDVEQFDHMINFSGPTPAFEGTLKECPKATVVFECPVRFQKNYDEIYQQSLKYTDRNTICVFGINSKNGTQLGINTTVPPAGAGAASEFSHLVYYCTFNWTPVPEESGKGYAFPAVEARQAIANAAKKITDDIIGSDEQSAPGDEEHRGNDLSKTFAYRWLDEDSREEYTPELSKTIDMLAKKDETALMGGMYDWRIEESDMTSYHQSSGSFLDDLNTAERLLRDKFVKLANNYKAINAEDGIVGCYVPESTLMMNQTAHDIIAGELTKTEGGGISAKGALTDTLAAGGKNPDTTAQDKESAKALTKAGAIVNECITPKIKTTKPVKFQQGDSGSYLGEGFYEAISSRKDVNRLSAKAEFFKALKSVRQSVFDPGHWFFENNAHGDWTNPQNCDSDSINDKEKMKSAEAVHYVQLAFNADRKNIADILFILYTSIFLSGNDAERSQKTDALLNENDADNPLRIPYDFLGRIPDADRHIAEGKAVFKVIALDSSSHFHKIYDAMEKNSSFKGGKLQNKIMELIREKDTEKAKKGVAEILAKHFRGQIVKLIRNEFGERIESGNFMRTLIAKTQAHLTDNDVKALLTKMLDEIIRENA